MCLNLVGSQFKTIKEVEQLLDCKDLKLTENDIINMKDNRKLIEKHLKKAQKWAEFWDMAEAFGL